MKNESQKTMDKYGLIGKNIEYSFSKKYFTKKFSSEGITASYQNFDIEKIEQLKPILDFDKNLKGLNVTIPYKEEIIPFLDELDAEATGIGAVNTIKIDQGKLIGYNTDCFGFTKTIYPLLENHHQKALILGTGGASKAIAYGLKSLGIDYKFVSRNASEEKISYNELSKAILGEYHIIINCTPLGTSPNIDQLPKIPYQFVGKKHLLYDLIYNPPISKFLANGKLNGATIYNGQKMLEIQAEKAWEIWNS